MQRAVPEELRDAAGLYGRTVLPKGCSSTTRHPNRPPILPPCCPSLAQQPDHNDNLWNRVALTISLKQFRLKLSSFFCFCFVLFFPLEKLVWGSVVSQQRGVEGWESIQLAFPLQNHCSNLQLGLYLWVFMWKNLFAQTSGQTPAEVDDYGYVREMRWKQLWL